MFFNYNKQQKWSNSVCYDRRFSTSTWCLFKPNPHLKIDGVVFSRLHAIHVQLPQLIQDR